MLEKKSQRGGAFMTLLVASTLAPITTNLINGLIAKIIYKNYQMRIRRIIRKSRTKNRRVYRKQRGGFFWKKSFSKNFQDYKKK